MPSTARDIAMKGGGYYSRATIGAKHVIDGATPLILDSIEDMSPPDDGLDLHDVGHGVRRRRHLDDDGRHGPEGGAPARPVAADPDDLHRLPRNDFSEVFRNVLGLTDVASYYDEIDNLHVFASGTSFHRQIVPPGTLHLGFSATASHYLSEKPAKIANHVHMVGATGAERAAYAEQGRRDWEAMLLHRARELAPGDVSPFSTSGSTRRGAISETRAGSACSTPSTRSGKSSATKGRSPRTSTSTPTSPSTTARWRSSPPVQGPDNPVHRAGLRPRARGDTDGAVPVRGPLRGARRSGRGSPTSTSRRCARGASHLRERLSADRPAEERAAILDRFYDRYEARVRVAPHGHAMDYVHCYLIASKVHAERAEWRRPRRCSGHPAR